MDPVVHTRVYRSPPPVSILSQINPVQALKCHFRKNQVNSAPLSKPISPKWSPSRRFPTTILCESLLSLLRNPCPDHPIGNIWHISLYVCVCKRESACVRARVCVVGGFTAAGVCLPLCSLTNPTCNAPPFRHLQSLWLHRTFRHYLINGTISEKKFIEHKCVFLFSLQLLFKTFLILRTHKRDVVTNVEMSSCKVPITLVGFWWNLNFLYRFSVKAQISSFIKLKSSGRTDGHDEASIHFSQFCERA